MPTSSPETSGTVRTLTNRPKRETGTLSEFVNDRVGELSDLYRITAAGGVPPIVHVPTGIQRLDDAGLLERGVATMLIGHEGDGKSALLLQFLEGAARAGFECQGYFLEDPARFTADRVISPVIRESAFSLRRGRVSSPAAVPARLKRAGEEIDAWGHRVKCSFGRLNSRQLWDRVREWLTPNTALVVIDYAQAFGGRDSESGMVETMRNLFWDANRLAEDRNLAVVVASQCRREVKERGRAWFDRWKYRHPDEVPTVEAVEGYRPMPGDSMWSSEAGMRARAVVSHFRPNLWLRQHQVEVPDTVCEEMIIKGNFGPTAVPIRLDWHGPTTRITDPRGRHE